MDFGTNKQANDNNPEFEDNFNDFEFNDEEFEFDNEVKKKENDYPIIELEKKEDNQQENIIGSETDKNDLETETQKIISENLLNNNNLNQTKDSPNNKGGKKKLLIKMDFHEENNLSDSLLAKSKSTKHCLTSSKVTHFPQSTKNQINNRRNSLHAKSTPMKIPIGTLETSSPFGRKKMSFDNSKAEVTCEDIEFLDNNYWKAQHIVTDEVEVLINELLSQGDKNYLDKNTLIKEDHFNYNKDSKL